MNSIYCVIWSMIAVVLTPYTIPQCKGSGPPAPYTYELYDWRSETGKWRFALLPTTNRNRTPSEIRRVKNTLVGEQELKAALLKLPQGTTIVLLPIPGEPIPQAYLPAKALNDLRRFAKEHGLSLKVMDQKTGRLD